jgi:hypothetical protein
MKDGLFSFSVKMVLIVSIVHMIKLYITRVNPILYQTAVNYPVIAHLVFNLTSKVDIKWGCYT